MWDIKRVNGLYLIQKFRIQLPFWDSFSFQKKFQAQKDDNSQINFWSGSPWIRRIFGVCMLSTSCGGRGRGVFEDQQKAEEMVVQGYLGCSPHRNELQNRTWSSCNHAEGTLWRWKAREMTSAEDFVAILYFSLRWSRIWKWTKEHLRGFPAEFLVKRLAGLFGISVKFFFLLSLSRSLSLHCMPPGSSKKTATEGALLEALVASRVPPTNEAARQNKVAIQAASLHDLFLPWIGSVFCCTCVACVLHMFCMCVASALHVELRVKTRVNPINTCCQELKFTVGSCNVSRCSAMTCGILRHVFFPSRSWITQPCQWYGRASLEALIVFAPSGFEEKNLACLSFIPFLSGSLFIEVFNAFHFKKEQPGNHFHISPLRRTFLRHVGRGRPGCWRRTSWGAF